MSTGRPKWSKSKYHFTNSSRIDVRSLHTSLILKRSFANSVHSVGASRSTVNNWVSGASPTLGCSIEILRDMTRMLKVSFGQLKPTCDTRFIHFYYTLEQL